MIEYEEFFQRIGATPLLVEKKLAASLGALSRLGKRAYARHAMIITAGREGRDHFEAFPAEA